MNEQKHWHTGPRPHAQVDESSSESFLLPGEDEQEFLDFRTRQILAHEPKGVEQLQLAMAIADIGWQINKYTEILERISPNTADKDETPRNLRFVRKIIRSDYAGVRRCYGFDRTMVPFSQKTQVLELDPTNIKLIETRISELEDYVDCLSAALRSAQVRKKGNIYVFGRTKLH